MDGICPTLRFHITKKCITLENNEIGFSAENIKALCDVGRSTKPATESRYIGQKGISRWTNLLQQVGPWWKFPSETKGSGRKICCLTWPTYSEYCSVQSNWEFSAISFVLKMNVIDLFAFPRLALWLLELGHIRRLVWVGTPSCLTLTSFYTLCHRFQRGGKLYSVRNPLPFTQSVNIGS